jgi:hypothetical protein
VEISCSSSSLEWTWLFLFILLVQRTHDWSSLCILPSLSPTFPVKNKLVFFSFFVNSIFLSTVYHLHNEPSYALPLAKYKHFAGVSLICILHICHWTKLISCQSHKNQIIPAATRVNCISCLQCLTDGCPTQTLATASHAVVPTTIATATLTATTATGEPIEHRAWSTATAEVHQIPKRRASQLIRAGSRRHGGWDGTLPEQSRPVTTRRRTEWVQQRRRKGVMVVVEERWSPWTGVRQRIAQLSTWLRRVLQPTAQPTQVRIADLKVSIFHNGN